MKQQALKQEAIKTSESQRERIIGPDRMGAAELGLRLIAFACVGSNAVE